MKPNSRRLPAIIAVLVKGRIICEGIVSVIQHASRLKAFMFQLTLK
jgi:hypothetical protein